MHDLTQRLTIQCDSRRKGGETLGSVSLGGGSTTGRAQNKTSRV